MCFDQLQPYSFFFQYLSLSPHIVSFKKIFCLNSYLLVFCLPVCLGTMHMPGTGTIQEGTQILWNLDDYSGWLHVGARKQTQIMEGSNCS